MCRSRAVRSRGYRRQAQTDCVTTQAGTSLAPQTRRLGVALVVIGGALLLAAVALYASGLSRAAGLWVAPLGLASLATGSASLRGWRVPRWLLALLAVAAVALLTLGLWTWWYSSTHPPQLV
jgi:ABC-type enterobactin transport system permease subunit